MPGEDNTKRLEDIEKKRAEKRAALRRAIDDKMTEEKLKLGELEDEHGLLGQDIEAVFSPKDGRMVVVRTPKPVVWNRFSKAINSSKPLTDEDTTALIYPCLVYPTKPEFEAIVSAAPGMLASTANACAKLAGGAREDAEGK